MTRSNIFIFLGVLLMGCEPSPTLPRLQKDAVILAFGDSLTYGTGASPESSYTSILGELTGLTVVNAGVPGEISRNGLQRLPNLLDAHEPNLLILIHGGNDILRKIPANQTENNIRAMIEAARQRNIAVVMLGVPRPGLFLMSSAGFYQEIQSSLQVASDLETLPEILGDQKLKSDMIHPNVDGYRIMAENIYRLLQQNGAL